MESPGRRVNVGCGRTPTAGWLNFDNSVSVRLAAVPRLAAVLARLGILRRDQYEFVVHARNAGVRCADARHIPVRDGTADVVYSSHMLEHLDRTQAREFLAEARRVLRDGGTIRIAVPDIKKQAVKYLESGDADAFVLSTRLVGERPRSFLHFLVAALIGPRHHQWMYDGPSLVKLLVEEGFVNAKAYRAGETSIADPGALDLNEREQESVYVEATRVARGVRR